MFVMWGPDPGVFMGVMDCSNHGSVVSGRGLVSKQAKWTRTVGECSERAGPPLGIPEKRTCYGAVLRIWGKIPSVL